MEIEISKSIEEYCVFELSTNSQLEMLNLFTNENTFDFYSLCCLMLSLWVRENVIT